MYLQKGDSSLDLLNLYPVFHILTAKQNGGPVDKAGKCFVV
jgi:hypothetical protein